MKLLLLGERALEEESAFDYFHGDVSRSLPPVVSNLRRDSEKFKRVKYSYKYLPEQGQTRVFAQVNKLVELEELTSAPPILELNELNEEILLACKVLIDYAEIGGITVTGVTKEQLREAFPSFGWDEYTFVTKNNKLTIS